MEISFLKKEVIRCYGFDEGYAVVLLKNFDSAILNEKGNISDMHFEQLGQKFSEVKNFAMFKAFTTGVIDTKENLLFKIDIADIDGALITTPFFNGRALIKKSENLWHRIKEFNTFYANQFFCELSRIQFRYDGIRKYNYINLDCASISPINFGDARNFKDGRALVKIEEENSTLSRTEIFL